MFADGHTPSDTTECAGTRFYALTRETLPTFPARAWPLVRVPQWARWGRHI